MQAFLQKGEGMMGIGQDVGFAAEIVGGLSKARQHVLKEHLKALFGQRQTGGQADDMLLHIGIETSKRAPRGFRHHAAAASRRVRHTDPMLLPP